MTVLRVAIVGGGIAGLACGALLAMQDHEVALFEKQAMLPAVGAGMLLQPVALVVLQHLQVLDSIRAHAACIRHLSRRAASGAGELQLHLQDVVLQVQHDAENYFGLLPMGSGEACLFWNMRLADHDALMQRDFAAWRARIGSRHPELRAALSSLTGFAEFRFDSFLDVRMPRWHSGRIVLIGDAAHATNPQLGMVRTWL